MATEMTKHEKQISPVASLVRKVRSMILSDEAGFEAAMVEIRCAIITGIASFITTVEARQITDAASYAADAEDGKRAVAYMRHVEELLGPIKEDFYRPYKNVSIVIEVLINPLMKIRDLIAKRITAWDRSEKERIYRERKEAEKKMAEERRKAEEERIESAEILSDAGFIKAADEILDRPVEIVPETVRPTEAPKIKGTTIRENWQWECVSLSDLVFAVIEGKVPLEAVVPNGTVIGKAAKAMKGTLDWPGIRVWDAGSVAFGGPR